MFRLKPICQYWKQPDCKNRRIAYAFENVSGYLIDTCLSAQDTYNEWVSYFYGDG